MATWWRSMLWIMTVVSLVWAGPAWAAQDDAKRDETRGTLKVQKPKEAPPIGYQEQPSEERFFFHFDGGAFYTLSDDAEEGSLSGFDFTATIAPTYRIQPRTFASLVYDGRYYKRRELYSDEAGFRTREEHQEHTLTPILRFDFGPNSRYSLKPFAFYTVTYNKDTDDSDWDDGLYNYEDVGAGTDFKVRELAFAGADNGIWTVGAQVYKRRYPNYDSLLDLAAGIGIEEDEKDYTGLILRTGYEWLNETGFSWSLDYSLLYKWLDDKKIVNSNGVLTDEEQEDAYHTLDLKTWYFFGESLRLGLDLRAMLKDSDQNYYDAVDTLPLDDDVFINNYYDYFLYRAEPNVSYTFDLFPLTVYGAVAYERTDYDDRLAQFPDQTYKDDEQWEEQKIFKAGLSYKINDNFSIVSEYEHTDYDSNNDDESVYQYDYWVDVFSAGLRVRF